MIHETTYYDRFPKPFKPASTPQRAALDCPAEFLKYGGAAGSLKSQTLLVRALKYKDRPTYKGLIIRKSYPEIRFLIDRSRDLYQNTGGRFYEAEKTWKWPWGASVDFKYIERDADVHKHQGWEYQFIGGDESTHQTEFQLRYLLNSRMRSTEGIPLQMFLATNPGNISHKTHKLIFQGPKCTHCILKEAQLLGQPPKWQPGSRKPFEIYHDAVWPSDRIPINHSTCFIPGKVSDHTLFGVAGGDYAKKLRGLSKALREALLDGCWEAFEGQFFDCFDLSTHYIPRNAVADKDWWPHWVSIDYGFAHATAAYLHTMSPERIVYTLAEYIIHRRKAVDVATDLKKIWGHHNIKAWYLSPDAFRHDGTEDLSRAEQMSQATNIFFDQAYNERISGAMLMYTLLAERRWFICDTCDLLPTSISSRIHDDDRDPEDVHKDETDEDDAYDGCLVAGTKITNFGDQIVTRGGPRKLKKAWKTGYKQCFTLYASNGTKLTGTGNHPIFVNGKFTRLDALRYGDKLELWQGQKSLNSTESDLGDIQTRPIEAFVSTSTQAAPTASVESNLSIKRFGSRLMGLFQKVTTFTTLMKTRLTTLRSIWKLSASLPIFPITESQKNNLKPPRDIWRRFAHWLQNGTDQRPVGHGTPNMVSKSPSPELQQITSANAANQTIDVSDHPSFAAMLANPLGAAIPASTISQRIVSVVIRLLSTINLFKAAFAHEDVPFVLGVLPAGWHDVYNLEVEGDHEYYANGILTHNSRYGIASYINPASPPLEEQLRDLQEKEWSQDPTVAMMQYLIYMKKQTQPNAVINYGPSRGRAR